MPQPPYEERLKRFLNLVAQAQVLDQLQIQFYPKAEDEGMSRRTGRHFSEQDREDLLQAAGAFRKALQTAQTHLKPFGEEYKACLKVQEAIEELAGVLTGDRAYFQEKLPP